ncbi:major capsid protein [Culicoidibacter larvae]|uniref:Phage capsid protein n=1 Tax=Culicoidibacter larvae TaxID=2579976 RepID=A0A5R8Q8B9_9FIRM|nr:phage capsid protein [Culicoidibacter larvae]TLG71380.1 phage capsid protein [Culicoidibacter larvae]
MAITLAEANINKNDKIVENVIDDFRRGSVLLDALTFDDAVTPGTGGSTLTYSYTQLKTPSTAGYRAINADYTPVQAKREKQSVELAILGGRIELDRVIMKSSTKAIDELDFQIAEKRKAITNEFHWGVINGDAAVKADSFDGLNKMLTGQSTEMQTTADLTLEANYFSFMEIMDNWLGLMNNRPTMIMGNSKMIAKLKAVARKSGYFSQVETAFGTTVDAYDNIPLVDLGEYYNGTGTSSVVGVTAGKTDLYAAYFDVNEGFHGVSLAESNPLDIYLPNPSEVVGSMYEGAMEMVAGVALKSTKSAAVLRGIKIA